MRKITSRAEGSRQDWCKYGEERALAIYSNVRIRHRREYKALSRCHLTATFKIGAHMLIGRELTKEHFFTSHVAYDLDLDGRPIGRLTWRPTMPWSDVVLEGRCLALGRERTRISESLAQIFAGAPARPFVLRDEHGSVLAAAQRVNSRTSSFTHAGLRYTARLPWGFKQCLEIAAAQEEMPAAQRGRIEFQRRDGVKCIVALLPPDFDLPTQILLFGLLHAIILDLAPSGD
jgi:hypothetical protein